MSWRADLWQQYSQLRDRIVHPLAARLGSWPGLLTVALLLAILTSTVLFFSRASRDAAAQSPSASGLAQMATRTPTPRAAVAATATASVTGSAAETATPIPTARPLTPTSTPTWTPLPTATQIAASPLFTAPVTPARAVPLPSGLTGPHLVPQLVPEEGITESHTLSATVTAEETVIATVTATITPAASGLMMLVPTPTPTLSINDALEQPVAPGGLAGLMATATAASSSVTDTSGEEESVPPEDEAEVVAPQPAATAAAQPTPDGNTRTVRVPILMYHYLSVPPDSADVYRLDLSVTPALFAAHLDAIQQAGYTTISLYTLLDHLMHGAPLPEKPVVLTFDDGYRDNYTNAFPLLRERGLTATFFLVTDFINDQRPEYLTWEMVREMYAAGMSIEGHGRNHVSLANKDRDYLIWQALGTYESIEHEIGVRPRFISYPAGEYDQRTIDIFQSANYWAGFTTKQGATHGSDDLFQLRRIRVRGSTTPEELLRLLALDW